MKIYDRALTKLKKNGILIVKLGKNPYGYITKGEDKMETWTCLVCGYVYDPAEGDPDNGVAPGTAFEDVPEEWVCPLCGVGKDQFEQN